jgi:hypothetical protein
MIVAFDQGSGEHVAQAFADPDARCRERHRLVEAAFEQRYRLGVKTFLREWHSRLLRCSSADLGGVDGFDQDGCSGEGDDGCEVSLGLFATQGDTLEALELADGLLDAGAPAIEGFREEAWLVLLVGLVRNDRDDAARACRLPIGPAGIPLVRDRSARIDIGAEPEQDWEMRRIALFASGQVEGDGMAVEIGLQMDLGGEAATGPPERLILLPPLAPAAETWARTMVESNICTRCAVNKRGNGTPARDGLAPSFST